MKGIIFNLLEEVVTAQFGDQAWDDILDGTGTDGAYTSLGNYPDEQFGVLLSAISRRNGQSDQDSLRWFGRLSMPFLARHYPEFFEPHGGIRSFLLSLNDVIHAEVRKLYPGADVPVFEFDAPAGRAAHDTINIHYRSKRQLCALAEGFITGASDYFKEQVTVTQPRCMLNGADECILTCHFENRPGNE